VGGAQRILIGSAPDDAARVSLLLCDGFGEPLELSTDLPEAAIARAARDGFDVLVLASTAPPETELALPVVMVVEDTNVDLATRSQRVGARICLFGHGGAPLHEVIRRFGREARAKARLEAAVRVSERVRALVYVSVSDVVFFLRVADGKFRFEEVNPVFLSTTGLTEQQVVGKLVDDVIPEPSLTLVLARYHEALTERRTVRWEEVTDYPSGKRYGEVSVTPLADADGVCRSLVGTVHDVTASARARALNVIEQRVLEMTASGESLADTLRTLVLAIEELAPPAIASVLLIAPDGKRLTHGAAPHLPEEWNRAIDGAPIGPTAGSCGTAAYLRRPVVVTDIEKDPLWKDYRDIAIPHGLRACWSSPIHASDARVLGTFALYYREPRSPTPEELDLIARASHVAGIAIQRHDVDEQLRGLAARLEAAREEERTKIARDIHDELGQTLTALKMDIAWIGRRATSPDGIERQALIDRLKQLDEMSDALISEVRRIASELRPGILDDLGLSAAVTWQAEEFQRRTGIECIVHADVREERIGRDLATTVFRAFQEALTNVMRHAEAHRVDVTLQEIDETLVLEVHDDGKGIRLEELQHPRSLGLVGIRERARRVGGTASFACDEAGGTRVTLRLPLDGAPLSRA
jgi:PAS domain S-box-containing protein